MMIWSVLLFMTLLAVSSAALYVLYSVVRAYYKHRMLGDSHGRSCETLDSIGVSVLGVDVYEPEQVENLLAVEYARYEVILVLDSRRRIPEFDALVARYRMIAVDYIHAGEFPANGVRTLYRSRKRGFRRLVIVDCAQGIPEGDLDVAASVAAYDYLLPVADGRFLLPDAVERLVIEVGERPAGSVWLVRSCIGEPAMLYSREAVAAAGGFVNRPARWMPGRRVMHIWEPIFHCDRQPCPAVNTVRGVAAVSLLGAMVAALWSENLLLLATLLTAALVWCCAVFAAQLLGERAGSPGCLYSGWRAEWHKKFRNS